MTSFTQTDPETHPDPGEVLKGIARRSFGTLATSSATNRPHVAAVLYETVGTALYVNTLRSSRKARNIAQNPHVGFCIPVRRLPVGPPSSVHFQAVATILGNDDPEIARLIESGRLRSITSHGELDILDGCFLRITPNRRIVTYGLGMSLRRLIRDPLHAGSSFELAE